MTSDMMPDPEKKELLTVPLFGPRMIEYLELVGISTLDELAEQSAEELRLRINEKLGFRHINRMGVKALENAIGYAVDRGG